MIDDERLQELLSKASSLYNNGEYKGAIEAWQEALGVDPASQKAKEGIRMATLLLGDADAPSDPGAPADGGEAEKAEAPLEEKEARVDVGVARVKQLLAERKNAEAIEGAQALLPLDPDSPDLQRLLEEAQHAFESTPFVEEHLTLARELLAQERFSEAEAECKKVFTMDATHPGAKDLLREIREKIQASLKAAASQLGGMTVKLTMPQAIAAGVKLRSPDPQPEVPEGPAIPEMYEGPDVDAGETAAPPDSGEGALAQEDVAARAALDAAFANEGFAAAPEESPFELPGTGPGAIGAPEPPAAAPETIVEARTVRPPTNRVAPKNVPPSATPPDHPHPAAAAATGAEAGVMPPPVVPGTPKKPAEAAAPPPHKPAATQDAVRKTGPIPAMAAPPKAGPAAPPAPAKPAAAKTPAPPAPAAAEHAEDATAAWETELTQLNLKDKERGLLRGTAAKATGKPVEPAEMDIMSLLDGGDIPGMAKAPAGPEPASVPLAPAKETPRPPAHTETAKSKPHADASSSPHESPAAVTQTRVRPATRPRPMPPSSRGGFSFGKLLLLLIVLVGGAGAAAWFYRPDLVKPILQPILERLPGGIGQPSHPVAPPAGAPSGTADPGHGPIPTPIGGTSRQQPATPQSDGAAIGAAPPSAPGAQAPAGAAAAPPAHPPANVPAAAGIAAPPPASTAASNEPIKPATAVPALSKEEAQRRIAAYTADGRRLIAQGKWREARAKLNAVLAIDPANIAVKELADQAQGKIDEDQKLQDEFEATKKLYADKDYENALRKLYRLPRDKGLGDIDLYTRNSWYNWAVNLLKAGNTKDALAKLSEELTLDPDDAQALKLQEVAERYQNRAKDRTYYAFTDGLTFRAFDAR